jgi:hypothetical protein
MMTLDLTADVPDIGSDAFRRRTVQIHGHVGSATTAQRGLTSVCGQ